ncbi:unnamed protein product, partial [Symbiodinium necroappetens]
LLTSAAKVTDVKRDTPTTASAGCFEIGWKTPRASSARTALARTASLSILRATGSLAAVATATVTATKKSEARQGAAQPSVLSATCAVAADDDRLHSVSLDVFSRPKQQLGGEKRRCRQEKDYSLVLQCCGEWRGPGQGISGFWLLGSTLPSKHTAANWHLQNGLEGPTQPNR